MKQQAHPSKASSPTLRVVKLSRHHELLTYLASGVLAVSGLAWLILHHFLRQTSEFGSIPHPLEPWCLRLHGAAVIGALVMLGSLLPNHIRRGLDTRRNHHSGIGLLAIMGVLMLTGYGLYYVGDEDMRPLISLVHWSIGLVILAALPVHVVLGKRKLRRTAKSFDVAPGHAAAR